MNRPRIEVSAVVLGAPDPRPVWLAGPGDPHVMMHLDVGVDDSLFPAWGD